MTPFSRLGGLAAASLDAIASALASASPLQHNSYRIAVTGLQRAGKTVFVTSFVHALLHAKDAPIEAFPFFPWRERVRAVELLDIPGLPRFPYAERLAELLAEPPRWPEPTEGLSGVRVRLRLAPAPRLSRLLEPRTLHLDLIDYPGEWLLDLPLLALDYEQWSVEMEELANAGTRAALSVDWQAQAQALDPAATEDPFALARIGSAYVDYLKRCRAEGLSYLQPGRFLAGTTPLEQLFFPLSRARGVRGGTNGGVLARRYEAYRKLVRRFYGEVFGRLRRQVVLVDLLTALQRGQELFADLALATRTVVEAFEELRHPLAKVLPVGRLDRLSLVATKADHITVGPAQQSRRPAARHAGRAVHARQCPPIRPAGDRVGASDHAGDAAVAGRGIAIRARRSQRTVRRGRSEAGRDPGADPRPRKLEQLRVQHPGICAAAARRPFRRGRCRT